MPQKSWIYWAIAIPITFWVLCSAYLYAYKQDALTGRVTKKTWWSHGVVPAVDSRDASRAHSAEEETPHGGGAYFGRFNPMRRRVPTSSSHVDWNRKAAWDA